METAYRLILYLLIANVSFLIFVLARKNLKAYLGYTVQLIFLELFMITALVKGYVSFDTVSLSIVAVVLLAVVPAVLQRRIDTLLASHRVNEIEPFARWKARLAWSDVNVHLHEISKALKLNVEAPELALENLRYLLEQGDPFDEMTRVCLGMLLFQARKYESLLENLIVPGRAFEKYPSNELIYLSRAFLETDRFESAAEVQMVLEARFSQEPDEIDSESVLVSRLVFFALMGWTMELSKLLEESEQLKEMLPSPLQKYWRGIAYYHTGAFSTGEELLEEALQEGGEQLPAEWLPWIQDRIADLCARKEMLTNDTIPRLKRLYSEHASQYSELIVIAEKNSGQMELSAAVTTTLIILNLIVHLVIYLVGDFYDPTELIRFGGNSPFLVRNGEYFRLLTYQFIHMGWLHLGMNLFALNIFGPPVETILGRSLFLWLYLFSGLFGGAVTAHFNHGISVGASASVLGLLSASIVLEFTGRREMKAAFGKNSMSTMIFILVLNIIIGIVEQGIDNSAHVGGLIGGTVGAGLIVLSTRNLKPSNLVSGFAAILTALILILGLGQFGMFYGRHYPAYSQSGGMVPIFDYLQIALPNGWTIENQSIHEEEYLRASIAGPIGERIDFVYGQIEGHQRAEFVETHAQLRTKMLSNASDVQIYNQIGPQENAFDGLTFQETVWLLGVSDRKVLQRDLFLFRGEDFFLFQTILPTPHSSRYDALLYGLIRSVSKLEGEKP